MMLYDPFHVVQTKYLFLTGKGGVGKTSVACATVRRSCSSVPTRRRICKTSFPWN